MSRRINLPTQEKGILDILLVVSTKGKWEREWMPLQGTPWENLVSIVPKESVDHALHGWSKPFVTALGLPPTGALRKVPVESRECSLRNRCVLYKSTVCLPSSPDLPWCFEPDGIEDGVVKAAAGKLLQLWKEGAYLVVVEE